MQQKVETEVHVAHVKVGKVKYKTTWKQSRDVDSLSLPIESPQMAHRQLWPHLRGFYPHGRAHAGSRRKQAVREFIETWSAQQGACWAYADAPVLNSHACAQKPSGLAALANNFFSNSYVRLRELEKLALGKLPRAIPSSVPAAAETVEMADADAIPISGRRTSGSGDSAFSPSTLHSIDAYNALPVPPAAAATSGGRQSGGDGQTFGIYWRRQIRLVARVRRTAGGRVLADGGRLNAAER